MKMLTYAETAELLGVSRGLLRGWVYSRRIPHVRLGKRSVRFVRTDLLLEFIQDRKVSPVNV